MQFHQAVMMNHIWMNHHLLFHDGDVDPVQLVGTVEDQEGGKKLASYLVIFVCTMLTVTQKDQLRQVFGDVSNP